MQHLVLLGVALAFLLQTLAWSAMPVLASGPADDGWIVVCTRDGIKRIPLQELTSQSASESDVPSRPSAINHCDLCVFAQGLSTASVPILVFAASAYLHVLRFLPDNPVFAGGTHTPHQPRAPPFLS